MITSFAPCTDAAQRLFIKRFWQTEGTPLYQEECILPKGEVELIFSFGDTLSFHRANGIVGGTPRCFINGMSNTPVYLQAPAHQVLFGVVLQPAAVRKLVAAPSGTFLNAIVDLELVDSSYGDLWHQLAGCAGFKERTAAIQLWVINKLAVIHNQEMALSHFLTNDNEIKTVTELAAHLCYSTRQLHRKVYELFGMSSEVLLRYKRYQRVLHCLHNSSETLTRVAYDCGYYDQAHFNREFKEYTGLTPGVYRQQQSYLPGHLYQ